MIFTKIPILLPQLFMNKLMMLPTSFVTLMSSTNFFFLQLDRFIQLLNTFSVVLFLEFVFSNLCMTISENPALFVAPRESLSVRLSELMSLSFSGARHKSSKQRVSPFYHG